MQLYNESTSVLEIIATNDGAAQIQTWSSVSEIAIVVRAWKEGRRNKEGQKETRQREKQK